MEAVEVLLFPLGWFFHYHFTSPGSRFVTFHPFSSFESSGWSSCFGHEIRNVAFLTLAFARLLYTLLDALKH
jgi:hypothetical protein